MPYIKYLKISKLLVLCLAVIFTTQLARAQESNQAQSVMSQARGTGANADIYDVVLKEPAGGNSSCPITIINRTTNAVPDDNMRFFLVLPDGNFLFLDKSNTTKGVKTPFSTEVYLQHFSPATDLKIDNLQTWTLEKNDPDPPPPPGALRVLPNYENENNVKIQTGTFKCELDKNLASTYLDGSGSLKVGTSWSPWPNDDAYYYIIITYTNKSDSEFVNGSVTLKNCLQQDPTGFAVESYTAYNAKGNYQWEKGVIPGVDLKFGFSGLRKDEVRHFYVKMKGSTKATDKIALYQAAIEYLITDDSTFTEQSECQEILLKGAPHDPNKKMVDQNNCTANGKGTLTYYVTFQNEGTAEAMDVRIEDKLPKELAPYKVETIGSSFPVTLDTVAGRDMIRYLFSGINLPGSTQTVPRIFDYNETIGWVKFKCSATCPAEGNMIENNASIVFIGADGFEQQPIITENIATVADTIIRAEWPSLSPCKPKCCLCIGGKKRKWCICFYRYRLRPKK